MYNSYRDAFSVTINFADYIIKEVSYDQCKQRNLQSGQKSPV